MVERKAARRTKVAVPPSTKVMPNTAPGKSAVETKAGSAQIARIPPTAAMVSGPDGTAKTKALATELRAALAGIGLKVPRPCKRAEIRMIGLDDSVTLKKIIDALAAAGACTLRRVKRRMAIRLIRGYMTVSCAVAVALTALVQLEVQAECYAIAYDGRKDLLQSGIGSPEFATQLRLSRREYLQHALQK